MERVVTRRTVLRGAIIIPAFVGATFAGLNVAEAQEPLIPIEDLQKEQMLEDIFYLGTEKSDDFKVYINIEDDEKCFSLKELCAIQMLGEHDLLNHGTIANKDLETTYRYIVGDETVKYMTLYYLYGYLAGCLGTGEDFFDKSLKDLEKVVVTDDRRMTKVCGEAAAACLVANGQEVYTPRSTPIMSMPHEGAHQKDYTLVQPGYTAEVKEIKGSENLKYINQQGINWYEQIEIFMLPDKDLPVIFPFPGEVLAETVGMIVSGSIIEDTYEGLGDLFVYRVNPAYFSEIEELDTVSNMMKNVMHTDLQGGRALERIFSSYLKGDYIELVMELGKYIPTSYEIPSYPSYESRIRKNISVAGLLPAEIQKAIHLFQGMCAYTLETNLRLGWANEAYFDKISFPYYWGDQDEEEQQLVPMHIHNLRHTSPILYNHELSKKYDPNTLDSYSEDYRYKLSLVALQAFLPFNEDRELENKRMVSRDLLQAFNVASSSFFYRKEASPDVWYDMHPHDIFYAEWGRDTIYNDEDVLVDDLRRLYEAIWRERYVDSNRRPMSFGETIGFIDESNIDHEVVIQFNTRTGKLESFDVIPGLRSSLCEFLAAVTAVQLGQRNFTDFQFYDHGALVGEVKELLASGEGLDMLEILTSKSKVFDIFTKLPSLLPFLKRISSMKKQEASSMFESTLGIRLTDPETRLYTFYPKGYLNAVSDKVLVEKMRRHFFEYPDGFLQFTH